MSSLVLYTELPEWWRIFELAISLSPPDNNGFLTISNIHLVVDTSTTTSEFWEAIAYFLNRENEYLYKRRKQNGNPGKNKS